MLLIQRLIIFILIIFLSVVVFAQEEIEKIETEVRLKDLCRIEGIRPNQLIGYGLVVGLDGTGDDKSTFFTAQSIVNMLNRLGISVDKEKMEVENVAAVMVTAQLPPFAMVGDKIDIVVASLGNAKSLEGGVLIQTPLFGPDNEVYALAQGPISMGGKVRGKRHLTVAQISQGAIIEKEVTCSIAKEDTISLILKEADFTTAFRITKAINTKFTPTTAKALAPSLVLVNIPQTYKENVVEFIAGLEELTLTPDTQAKVIINERTGTVVMGKDIRISEVAVSHGNISLVVKGAAETESKEEKVVLIPPGVSINDIVSALNSVGATSEDLIAILQAIRAAGALHAEIIIM
ncbi:MAG: flagellar basal body P-ring protein FlgI [bacterium]